MISKRTSSKADDLKLIQGISRSVERRLHEEGIAKYSKLASMTPQAISEIVGETNGVTTKRIIRDRWVEQARELSTRSGSTESKDAGTGREHLDAVDSQKLAQFAVELSRNNMGQTERTKVFHIETNDEDSWEGWQEQRLLDFIVSHAGLCLRPEETEIPTACQPEQTVAAEVAREAIRDAMIPPKPASIPDSLSESRPQQFIAISTMSGRPTCRESEAKPIQANISPRNILSAQSFELHLAIDLCGIVPTWEKPIYYTVNVYATNLNNPLCQFIGETKGETDSIDTSHINIKCNPLQHGLYRLHTVVALTHPNSRLKRKASPIFLTEERLLRAV